MKKVYKKLLSILLSAALLVGILGTTSPSKISAASVLDNTIILLPGNSVWQYNDTGANLGTEWRTSYDDSSWSSSDAPFGYKADKNGNVTTISTKEFGESNTLVSFGGDVNNKHITTYFRTNLEVDKEQVDQYSSLLGTFAIDDGAVIYVNGTEIARFGFGTLEDEVSYSTYAESGLDLPVLYKDVNLTAELKANLHDGANEIAVEVHQQRPSSSDLYFDMELYAIPEAAAVEVSKVTVTFNGDSTSSKGFTWYTPEVSTNSDLQVVENTGEVANFDNTLSFTGQSKIATNSSIERVHKAEATGLKANTSYYFRVGDHSLDSWSEVGTFQTAPTSGAFSFIDLTDTQAQDEEEAIISASTISTALATVPEAQFIVHNGDVVEHGNTEQEWNWLLGHSQPSLLNTTIAPAAGNHEDKNYAFFDHFNVSTPENAATEKGAYYSFDYSNAHFIVLNSNENSTEYANFSVDQVEWMKQDVEAAKDAGAEWIIANIHKGPYTTANHATDSDIFNNNGVRKQIAPLMNELGIDLVLQGHDHIYARTKPIKSDGTAEDVAIIEETLNGETIKYAVEPDGTIYMIPATAGAKVYFKNTKTQLGDDYFSLFERSEENHARNYGSTTSEARGNVQNFVGISIDGGKLTAVTYEIDKNIDNGQPFIIDQFGIVKSSTTEPETGTEPDYSDEKVSKVTVTFNGDPVSSKGFTWYTSERLQGNDLQVVEKLDAAPDYAKAVSFNGRSSVSSNSVNELVHKVEATGLKANTAYYFRVGDAELNIWSETGTFQTAPKGGAFTFIDLADTQAKDEDEAILSSETIAKALATVPAAQFIVHNGDIVDTGTKEEQWDWLLGHSQDSLLNTTIVPSAGNHEDKNFAFYEHFNLQEAENSAIETGAYYSYDYSNAHFIVLNSNENSTEYANFSVDQVEWLKQDTKAAKDKGAEWIIVNIHKGPYTTSNHATDKDIIGENGVRNKIAPLMAELEIDFVVQGHDHIYARTKPIKANGTASQSEKITESWNGEKIEYTVNPDGSIYLIPATAGPKVYYKNKKEALGEAYYSLFERAEENHAAEYGPDPSDSSRPVRGQVQNFVGITIEGSRLTAITYEIDQNINNAEPFIVDRFGIVKSEKPTKPGPGTKPGTGNNSGTEPTPGEEADSNSNPETEETTDPAIEPETETTPSVVLNDVAGHWAASAISQAVNKGIIFGYKDGSFRPEQAVNRAEFITLLGRALQMEQNAASPIFKDAGNIPAWAQSFVAQAVISGIINGYDDGTFGPEKQMNRAEMVAIILRASGLKPIDGAALSFADASDIPTWAVPYIAAAAEKGLVKGVGNNRFAPLETVSRAQAVTIIMRLLSIKA